LGEWKRTHFPLLVVELMSRVGLVVIDRLSTLSRIAVRLFFSEGMERNRAGCGKMGIAKSYINSILEGDANTIL
jgi:hypothetical protein